ncbi:MAG TPA: hypothetical protein VF611_04910 [Pyrinomonadaceae bacterium]
MITGFNTDVPYEGVTYHVQTEDKGLDSPLILSLVYVGGAIIASKRTPYEDLVGGAFDEQALTERLQRQHKLIIAAIKAGRIEDLKRMGGPNGGAQATEPEPGGAAPAGKRPGGLKRKKPEPAPPAAEVFTRPPAETASTPPAEAATRVAEEVAIPQAAGALSQRASEAAPPPVTPLPAAPAPAVPVPAVPAPATSHPAAPNGAARAESQAAELVAPAPPVSVKAEPEIVILTSLADEINALGDMPPRVEPKPPAPPANTPPVQPVVTPADEAAARPVLTAEILETPGQLSDELYLTLLDDEGEFRAGQLATVKVYVGRGAYGQRPEAEASVTVKVLGTSFRPLILTTETDALGVGVVRALLPRFNSGRAAIIIRAVAGDDSAEMRRIIHQ